MKLKQDSQPTKTSLMQIKKMNETKFQVLYSELVELKNVIASLSQNNIRIANENIRITKENTELARKYVEAGYKDAEMASKVDYLILKTKDLERRLNISEPNQERLSYAQVTNSLNRKIEILANN